MPSDYLGNAAFLRSLSDGLTPDPAMTVAEWADNYRILSGRAAAEVGKYRTSRTHSDTQIDQIAASIREFGWTKPILVDAAGTNVPGVFSVRDNAFGCFLSGLSGENTPFVPPRGKWTNAGVALGLARAVAWRILNAQFFGLPQCRRRVFVVASAREGFDPAAVLLEFEGLRRDTPPRRETRQDPAVDARRSASVSSGSGWWSDSSGLGATLRAQDIVTKADTLVHCRSGERSHWDGVEHPHPTLSQSFNTGGIGYSNQKLFSQRGLGLVGDVTAARMVAFGECAEDGTASTLKSRDYKDANDLVAQTSNGEVSHCLNEGGTMPVEDASRVFRLSPASGLRRIRNDL